MAMSLMSTKPPGKGPLDPNGEPGSPFGSGGPFPGGFVDISDIAIDGLLGDLLGVFGVGRGEKGNLKRDLEVTFEEAAFGCEKTLQYERVVSCTDCGGSGAAAGTVPESCGACNGRGRVRFQQGIFPIAVERTCSRCRGTGKSVRHACSACRASGLVSSSESLKVTLPAGVDAGATKLVNGAGNKPRSDKPAGDLEIFLESRGYYYEWLRPSWLPEESALALALFALDPRGEMRRLAPAYKRIEPDMDRVFWQSRLGAERVR